MYPNYFEGFESHSKAKTGSFEPIYFTRETKESCVIATNLLYDKGFKM
jgi:hypothetical protein